MADPDALAEVVSKLTLNLHKSRTSQSPAEKKEQGSRNASAASSVVSENPEKVTEEYKHLVEKLDKLQCPFTWDPKNQFYMDKAERLPFSLEEKLQEIKEESTIQWRKLILCLVLCYEYAYKNENTDAHLHLRQCETILADYESWKDFFSFSVHDALQHVILASKSYLTLRCGGNVADVEKIMEKVPPESAMHIRTRSALFAVRAAVSMEYGYAGTSKAIEYAKEAVAADDLQGEWHFLLGKALGRLRRVNSFNELPSEMELKSLEKGVELTKNAGHMVFLAQAYREAAFRAFSLNRNTGGSWKVVVDKMNKQSAELYRSALDKNPDCAHINTRCALGFLRLPPPHRDMEKALQCSNKALSLAPTNAMAWHVAGQIAQQQGNLGPALEIFKRAGELGAFGACMDYCRVRSWIDSQYDPLDDLHQFMERYREPPRVQEVKLQIALYHLLIKNDLSKAISVWLPLVKEDPDSERLKTHKSIFAKMKAPVNLYEVMCDETRIALAEGIGTPAVRSQFREVVQLCLKHDPTLANNPPLHRRQMILDLANESVNKTNKWSRGRGSANYRGRVGHGRGQRGGRGNFVGSSKHSDGDANHHARGGRGGHRGMVQRGRAMGFNHHGQGALLRNPPTGVIQELSSQSVQLNKENVAAEFFAHYQKLISNEISTSSRPEAGQSKVTGPSGLGNKGNKTNNPSSEGNHADQKRQINTFGNKPVKNNQGLKIADYPGQRVSTSKKKNKSGEGVGHTLQGAENIVPFVTDSNTHKGRKKQPRQSREDVMSSYGYNNQKNINQAVGETQIKTQKESVLNPLGTRTENTRKINCKDGHNLSGRSASCDMNEGSTTSYTSCESYRSYKQPDCHKLSYGLDEKPGPSRQWESRSSDHKHGHRSPRQSGSRTRHHRHSHKSSRRSGSRTRYHRDGHKSSRRSVSPTMRHRDGHKSARSSGSKTRYHRDGHKSSRRSTSSTRHHRDGHKSSKRSISRTRYERAGHMSSRQSVSPTRHHRDGHNSSNRSGSQTRYHKVEHRSSKRSGSRTSHHRDERRLSKQSGSQANHHRGKHRSSEQSESQTSDYTAEDSPPSSSDASISSERNEHKLSRHSDTNSSSGEQRPGSQHSHRRYSTTSSSSSDYKSTHLTSGTPSSDTSSPERKVDSKKSSHQKKPADKKSKILKSRSHRSSVPSVYNQDKLSREHLREKELPSKRLEDPSTSHEHREVQSSENIVKHKGTVLKKNKHSTSRAMSEVDSHEEISRKGDMVEKKNKLSSRMSDKIEATELPLSQKHEIETDAKSNQTSVELPSSTKEAEKKNELCQQEELCTFIESAKSDLTEIKKLNHSSDECTNTSPKVWCTNEIVKGTDRAGRDTLFSECSVGSQHSHRHYSTTNSKQLSSRSSDHTRRKMEESDSGSRSRESSGRNGKKGTGSEDEDGKQATSVDVQLLTVLKDIEQGVGIKSRRFSSSHSSSIQGEAKESSTKKDDLSKYSLKNGRRDRKYHGSAKHSDVSDESYRKGHKSRPERGHKEYSHISRESSLDREHSRLRGSKLKDDYKQRERGEKSSRSRREPLEKDDLDHQGFTLEGAREGSESKRRREKGSKHYRRDSADGHSQKYRDLAKQPEAYVERKRRDKKDKDSKHHRHGSGDRKHNDDSHYSRKGEQLLARRPDVHRTSDSKGHRHTRQTKSAKTDSDSDVSGSSESKRR